MKEEWDVFIRKPYVLNNERTVPKIGLGTSRMENEDGKLNVILEKAFEIGYRHFDTAKIYGTESAIGKFLTDKPREDLFITSKLWADDHDDVHGACRRSLSNLKTTYLDLYLVHCPMNTKGKLDLKTLWSDMESLVTDGLVRSIGVSNFGPMRLKEILSDCSIKPAVNQIELHPYLPQNETCSFCDENGIKVVAYSPLGSSLDDVTVRNDPVVNEIAKKHNVSAAKILLGYALKRGCCVIPRTSSPEHLEDNFTPFELSEEEFRMICNIETRKRCIKVAPEMGEDLFK